MIGRRSRDRRLQAAAPALLLLAACQVPPESPERGVPLGPPTSAGAAEEGAGAPQEPAAPREPGAELVLPEEGAGAIPADALARAEQEVEEELAAYYRDFSTRDWNAVGGHFWEGAILVTIGQPSGETEERVVITPISSFLAEAAKAQTPAEEFESWLIDSKVRIQGRVAQVWARFGARLKVPAGAEVMEWEGTDAFTLLRHGGTWRITSLILGQRDPEE